MADIDQLIDDYELASARLTDIIVDADLQDEKLHAANDELDRAFCTLLNAKFDNQKSISAHIEYMLTIITNLHPDDNVLAQLAERIQTNVVRLLLLAKPTGD